MVSGLSRCRCRCRHPLPLPLPPPPPPPPPPHAARNRAKPATTKTDGRRIRGDMVIIVFAFAVVVESSIYSRPNRYRRDCCSEALPNGFSLTVVPVKIH